ncbi:MAG TPA: N-acetylmuramoyl-L-alanine amidase [Parasegetibacter sp.]
MIKKISYGFALVTVVIIFSAFIHKEVTAPASNRLRTLIIDPGHGGSDPGAVGKFSKEKDITLAISLKVGDLLKREMPDVQVLFTRTTDVYPSLPDRAKFANDNKGDLFVSIHVNAAPPIRRTEIVGYKNVTTYKGKGKNRKKVTQRVPIKKTYSTPNPAKGTETYIWGAHKNEEKQVALKENAPLLLDENYKEMFGDMDPNSTEFMIYASLKTKQYFKRSASLAMFVEEEYRKVGRTSRDVKQRQAGIWVLQATAMPSILIETGFISNPEEEEYLNSEEGQNEQARCIVTAIKRYKLELEINESGNDSGESSQPLSDSPGNSSKSSALALLATNLIRRK